MDSNGAHVKSDCNKRSIYSHDNAIVNGCANLDICRKTRNNANEAMANAGDDTKETTNSRDFFFMFYESCINEDRVARSTFRGL